jgi:formylglycine-generating enzyme required for sulfatase activity
MGVNGMKKGLRIGFTISGIALLTVLISLSLLSTGSTKELAETDSINQPPYSSVEGSSENKTIIIDLPGLPEDAKRLEMVLINPGKFIMGSPKEERGRSDCEWSPHEVTITKPFYMGKYEVTQAQWEAVMGSDSHHSKFRDRPNNPVEKVSWYACQKFIKRLNALGKGTFRLPTEAEWEFTCRAGTNTRFSFGDASECGDIGNEYCEIADKHMWWSGNNDPEETKEVGLKLPNPWGLYDMHGNVSEWCSDLWEVPHQRESQTDPTGPSPSWFSKIWPLSNHVNRGGSIYCGKNFRGACECRSASRHYEQAIDYHWSLGFRLVMEYP